MRWRSPNICDSIVDLWSIDCGARTNECQKATSSLCIKLSNHLICIATIAATTTDEKWEKQRCRKHERVKQKKKKTFAESDECIFWLRAHLNILVGPNKRIFCIQLCMLRRIIVDQIISPSLFGECVGSYVSAAAAFLVIFFPCHFALQNHHVVKKKKKRKYSNINFGASGSFRRIIFFSFFLLASFHDLFC